MFYTKLLALAGKILLPTTFYSKYCAFCVVLRFIMVVDLYRIQAAIGSGGSQSSPNYNRMAPAEAEKEEDGNIDFGLEGREPDCRVFLSHSVTTLAWLKSHHLLSA